MESKIKRLINKLNESFSGEPLYGESLISQLSKVQLEIVNVVPMNSNKSIAKLLQHIIYWRTFAIEKVGGIDELNKTDDWSEISINALSEWEELLNQLNNTQEELIKLLNSKSDDFLSEKLPNRSYDYESLIVGTIQHDIYHLGQIGLVAKQAKNK